MPFDVTIDVGRGSVSTRYWGRVTDQDVLGHHTRLTTDPLFNPNFFQIVDCRDVTSINSVHAHIIRHVAQLRPFSDRARRVMVIDPPNSLLGFAFPTPLCFG
jgi:hypothetical protein